jgi:N-acetylmuramoyl-L-alanine amidase
MLPTHLKSASIGILLATAGILGAIGLAGFASPACASLALKPVQPSQGRWAGGSFPDTSFEGVRYVSSLFLENLFGREGAWVPDRQKFVIPDSSGKKWFFTLDNPYMNIGDEVFNLGFPVRRGSEFFYLPLPSLLRILNQRGIAIEAVEPVEQVQAQAPSDKPVHRPAALPGGANMLDVGAEERDNGTLVTVRTGGKLDWESFWVPPHFILKLQGGQVAPQYPLKAQGQGLVKNILTVQEKDMAQVTLYIPKAIDTVEVSYSEEALAFQILVRKKSDKKTVAAQTASAREDRGPEKTSGTIIIDPGHGGKDQGAQVSGVNEAQVTLAVAKELKAALTKMGYKALMTREEDVFVSLPDRPKFASSHGGDLFISLHCNSIAGSTTHKKAVTGFTAYLLREGESEEDKALARRENEAVSEESGKNNKSEISPVEWILMEHQLNLYGKESESFVDKIVNEFSGFPINKYATGAGQAGFYVLVGAYMPAVLFEMGFLTHDEDRRILSSEKGQKQVAERLAKAIQKFRQGSAGKSIAGEGKKANAK